MDDLRCSGEVVHQTLRELETINKLLGGNHVTLDGIKKLYPQDSRNISVADLGCGGGDILRLIYQWADRSKRSLTLTGIDANPFIIDYAKEHTPESFNIKFEAVDIFSKEFQSRKFDIVTGTLFFHHFSNDSLVTFFKQLRSQTRIGFIINDIHRHWFAYYSIKYLTSFFSRSPMVKFDGPISVLRAFKKKDLIEILKHAGISNYQIRWMWAFRWQVIVHQA